MKVLFLLEAGIPSYRNFLFNYLNKHPEIDNLLVLHTGRIYNHKEGDYDDRRVEFIGNNKLGFHLGIWKYLRKADVIIASYNLRIITCWLPCLFWPSKMIFWGKGLGENELSLILKLRRFTANRSKYLLVYNQYKKQEIIDKLGLDKNKVIAYQNSIAINNPKNCGQEKKLYFLYFGRLQERKGLTELVDAYKDYLREVQVPLFKLRIVGDGNLKHKLEKSVKDYSIEGFIEFYPGVYNEKAIRSHFRNAIAYVSPYNVGLAVINSFSYGVPVVTCFHPQVGPEYHYLNEVNAIKVKDKFQITDIFKQIEKEKFFDNDKIFQYYLNNLHFSIMEKNFANTILKLKYE